jgi:hypothetical protein
MSALLLGLLAAAAPSLTVDVAGKCPTSDAVAAALGSAVGTDPKATELESVPDQSWVSWWFCTHHGS